jgi:hypothetical protein
MKYTYTHTNVNVRAYARLKSGYKCAKEKFSKRSIVAEKVSLDDFFGQIKKGSRKFRKVLYNNSNCKNKSLTRQNRTYTALLDLPAPDPTVAKSFNVAWYNVTYDIEFRVFLFKLYNNILGLNARVAHFNDNTDPVCTFCKKRKIFPAPRETFSHMFWYCPVTNEIIHNFERDFLNFRITKENFFVNQLENASPPCRLIQHTFNLFKFILWKFKLKKRAPTWIIFRREFLYHYDSTTSLNLRDMFSNSQLFRNHGEQQ